jgi:tRNA threonylcarbamoyladenosine biosynthesis protein TsaB
VTARVLGAALGLPVYGVCSLDVIAADTVSEAKPGGDFLVATDARRRELYWARYDSTGRRTFGPDVSRPAEIPVSGLPAAGEGPLLYPGLLPDGLGPAFPAAAALCRIAVAALADGDPGETLLAPEPLYLRRPDAREPGAPKRVTA